MPLISVNRFPPDTTGLADECVEARKREVENALLVQALCERYPSLHVREQLLRYIAGEISREQAFADLYAGMC